MKPPVGIDDLRRQIVGIARAMLPQVRRLDADELQQVRKSQLRLRGRNLFLTVAEAEKVVSGNWAAQSELLEMLGMIRRDPLGELVCTRPGLLARVVALFVAPDDHVRRLASSAATAREAVLSMDATLRQLRQLPELAQVGSEQVERALRVLESMGICFRISNGASLVFPSLCAPAELLNLPFREGQDHCAQLFPVRPPGGSAEVARRCGTEPNTFALRSGPVGEEVRIALRIPVIITC